MSIFIRDRSINGDESIEIEKMPYSFIHFEGVKEIFRILREMLISDGFIEKLFDP